MISACEKDEESGFTDSPIVEAYLNAGDYFSVKVSRQVPFSSDVSYSEDDIDNLELMLVFNDSIYFLNPVGDGVYSDTSLLVSENDEYWLSFEFNGKEVSAYTYVPSHPDSVSQSETEIYMPRIDSTGIGGGTGSLINESVEICWYNADDSYYLVLVENVEDDPDPIRDFGDEEPPEARFRKSPTDSNTEEIRSMEFQYFGTHRIIIYHVLPDYAALYDENSNSSQNLTNPSSSITNAYGIFTGINADTLWLEVIEE